MLGYDKLLFESLDEIRLFEPNSLDLIADLDQPKSFTLENTVELTELTGKNEVTLGTLERQKSTTFTFSNGYVLTSVLAAQAGTEVEDFSAENIGAIPWYERIEITSETSSEKIAEHEDKLQYTVSYEYPAVGVEGSEILAIWKANGDGSQGQQYDVSVESSETAFEIDNETQTIKLPIGEFDVGDMVIIPYYREAKTGKRIVNRSDAQSKIVRVMADITAADPCDQNKKYHVLFDMPQGKLDGNSTLEFGTDGTYPEISVKAISNICSASKELCAIYVIDGEGIGDDSNVKPEPMPPAKETPVGEKAINTAKTNYDNFGTTEDFYQDGELDMTWSDTDCTVKGIFKFNKSTGAENLWTDGYYFAVSLDEAYSGKPITVQIKNGNSKTAQDLDWICNVSPEKNEVTFKDNEDVIAKFDLSGATFANPVGEDAFVKDKVDYGRFGKNTDYYQDGIINLAWDGTNCTVTGTLNFVHADSIENLSVDSNYFAFALTENYQNKPITVQIGSSDPKTVSATDWVCRVSKENNKITVKDGDVLIAVFDLSGATFKES